MEYPYIYFSNGTIYRDGKEGFLTNTPVLPVEIRMLSFGKDVEQFYLDLDGMRHDLSDEELTPFTDAIMPLINEDSFELGDLYIENSSLTSKLEATDYIEFGVKNGYFAEADYIGVLNDRKVWVARQVEIDARIVEINQTRLLAMPHEG